MKSLTSFYLSSLGCARNTVDSENMSGMLTRAGWQNTDDPEDAEIIIVNTCSFIETAAQESIDTILSLAENKTRGNCHKLIVTGCLPERYREEILTAIPEVDIFLGTGAYDQIIQAVDSTNNDRQCLLPDPDNGIFSTTARFRSTEDNHSTYLKIAEGCDRKCTFCIIPKLRGRQKNRPLNQIVSEAEMLIKDGAGELVLVAQETTAYQCPATKKRFGELIEAVAAVNPSVWVRMLYGHPLSLDLSMMKIIAETPNICTYFDLPIQHTDDTVLKHMGRAYTQKDIIDKIHAIRDIAPEAAIRTTVIVGFPGETESAFTSLLNFIETIKFDHLGGFTYSDADDLPAHGFENPVSAQTAETRLNTLMQLQQRISEQNNCKYIGKIYPVLVDSAAEPGIYLGRTAFQAPEVDGLVYIHADDLTPGTFVDVRIDDSLEYDLVGKSI